MFTQASAKEKGIVVALSGGQDSTTVLFWAKKHYKTVEAVTFDYGQQHSRERESVIKIAEMADVPLMPMSIPALKTIEGGGLTNEQISVDAPHPQFPNLPGSFVPLRNLIILSTVAAYAIKRNIYNIATGVCQTDYSGYPDCRKQFTMDLERVIEVAMDIPLLSFKIETPLMFLTKKQTVLLAAELPGCMQALAWSHTCYNNEFPPCGKCPACVLRQKGFDECGIYDPLIERARRM